MEVEMRPMVGPNGAFEPYRPKSAAERRRVAERFIEHRAQRRTYQRMSRAEIAQREMDRLRNAPFALAHLETVDRDESAMLHLLQGLRQRYRESLMAGRLDVWAAAAHKIIDLLSDPLTEVHKRRDL
jgi:hypothetical protein